MVVRPGMGREVSGLRIEGRDITEAHPGVVLPALVVGGVDQLAQVGVIEEECNDGGHGDDGEDEERDDAVAGLNTLIVAG